MITDSYINEILASQPVFEITYKNKNKVKTTVLIYDDSNEPSRFILRINRYVIHYRFSFGYTWQASMTLYSTWRGVYYSYTIESHHGFSEREIHAVMESYFLEHPEKDIRYKKPLNSINLNQYRWSKNEGYIYLLQCKATNVIKIGKTKDLRKRIREVRNMSPTPLKVLAVFECEYAKEVDDYLCQTLFRYRNDHSEWFCLEEKELERFLLGRLPYPINELLLDVTEDVKRKVIPLTWFK